MKRAVFLFTMVIAILNIANAQPPGDGWINLGDYIKGVYNYGKVNGDKMKTVEGYAAYDKPLEEQKFVTKLAYKDTQKNKADKSIIRMYRYSGFDKENKIKVNLLDKYQVNGDFSEIYDRSKRIDKKSLQKTNDGWIIFELDTPSVIAEIYPKKSGKLKESTILEDIYVQIDESRDPVKLYEKLLAEEKAKQEELIAKQEAERKAAEEKKQQEFLLSLYTTPKDKGWIPVKTEKLKDGTIVEHYTEGVRFYKKPNGDFASFLEPKDSRDPKTLDLINGMNLPIEGDSKPIGDFQFTFGNGVIGYKIGNKEEYKTKKNQTIKINPDNNNTIKFGNYNSYIPLFGFTYAMFDNPKQFANELSIGGPASFIDNIIKNNILIYTTPDLEKEIPLNSYKKGMVNYSNSKLQYEYQGEVFGQPIMDLENAYYVYRFDNNGLNQIGVIIGEYIPISSKVVKDDGKKITFENGDFIYYSIIDGKYKLKEDAHVTLNDGTVFEKIEDKYRIITPDNTRFVGEVEYYEGQIPVQIRDYLVNGYNSFENGFLTLANGKEYEITYGKIPKQFYYTKYGQANVDAASKGDIRIGMSLQMLKDMGVYIIKNNDDPKDGTYLLVTGFADYMTRMKYKIFTVNLSTGKIIQIGKEQVSAK